LVSWRRRASGWRASAKTLISLRASGLLRPWALRERRVKEWGSRGVLDGLLVGMSLGWV
jgi:hypothetical protein